MIIPVTGSKEGQIKIDGFVLDESQVSVGDLVDHTHGNFHKAATSLEENNTPELILELLVGEIDELLEVLENFPNDRLNLVAELGDLFHFWNDLVELTNFDINALINFLDSKELDEAKLSIQQAKQVSRQTHQEIKTARDLLYHLRGFLMMRAVAEINKEVVGMVASYIFAVATELKVNVIYATLMKNLRNLHKYDPAEMNQLAAAGLNYLEIREMMVAKWSNGRGGDENFFAEFLKLAPLELSTVSIDYLASDE